MRGNSVRLKLYRGRWYAVWLNEAGDTKRTSLRTKDRALATRNLAALLAAQAAPRETAADIMQAFLADKAGRPSQTRSADAWKRLEPHFGRLRPVDITRPSCREYTAMRGRRAKPGTIIKELSVLRAALNWHDKHSPADIEMPRQPPPRDRYLTREEYRTLRDASVGIPHCQLFIIVAYATAGRAGAVLELTWDRVDFKRGLIHLATADEHGNKGRAIVPMNPGLRAALEAAQKAALSEFVIEYAGRRVKSVRRAFKAACAKARLAGVTPHVLRHTAAVHMAEGGVSMAEIAQYLGHSNMTTTFRVYARYSPDHLRAAASVLE